MIEREGGRVVAVRDRRGEAWIEAVWDGTELLGAEVAVPGGGRVGLRPRVASHPILGTVHEVFTVPEGDDPGRHLAWCAAADFGAPAHIPAMDAPGALPSGAGSALLNLLALHAAGPLRYRGPYPTGALFDGLSECFAPTGDPAAAFATFNAGVDAAATVEPAVDFAPDPFERHRVDPAVVVQLRRGVQRAWIDGASFQPHHPTRRLVRGDGGWSASIVLGTVVVATVARLDEEGELVALDRPARTVDVADVPPRLRRILADALGPRAPALVRDRVVEILDHAPMVLGDAGWDAVAVRDGVVVLHAEWPAALRADPPALEALARAVEDAVLLSVVRAQGTRRPARPAPLTG